MKKKYLPFFWDYQITEAQLKRILRGDEGKTTKIWAMSRVLESASYDEVWKHISLQELREIFPQLRLKKPVEKAWRRAFKVWAE